MEFSAGRATGTVARVLAEVLRSKLDRNMAVDTRIGTNGIMAAGELQSAQPDGYGCRSSIRAASPSIRQSLFERSGSRFA